MNGNDKPGGYGRREGHSEDRYRKDGAGKGDYRKDNYRKDNYRKDDTGRVDYRKDNYRKDGIGRDDHRKDHYGKDNAGRSDYRKDNYRKDGTGRSDHRKDHYGKDNTGRVDYRKDNYRKDGIGRDDHRKDHYGKDNAGRGDYRKDNYRKDDTGRVDYRKDNYRKDNYRKDDTGRGDYRKDNYRKDATGRVDYRKDNYRKDDTGRVDYRKDNYRKDDTGRVDYRKDNYRKDATGRGDYRKDNYRKDGIGRDDHRKDHYGKDNAGRGDYRKDNYRKDDTGRGDYRKDNYRKDATGRGDYRKDNYRKDDTGRSDYRKDNYRKDDTGRSDYRKDNYREDRHGKDQHGKGRYDRKSDRKEYPKDGARRAPRGKDESTVGVRQLIQRILAEFDASPGDPERIADRILARRNVEHRDRRFIFEIVYGVLRNRIYLDYVIDTFISGERDPMSDALRRVLRIGAYQILFLDRVPDHAAVNETVNLVKRDPNTAPASGFINAVLRNVIKNKFSIALPDSQADLCGRLSVEFSHPKWMVERWLARYGLGDTKKILAFNNERPAVYLRRKMRDISRAQFEHDMRTLCDAPAGYLGLYYKMKKPLEPENLRILQDGFCSVQAPSCGWVVAMLGLRDGERALDMCSAPGGKATLMAELVGESGFVAAADLGRWKMKLLAEAVEAQGFGNIYPVVCDGVCPPFSGTFDKVLLDAPCSGSGVLQRHPDGRFVRTAEDIESIASLQRDLLDNAAKLIGAGGALVYSTCSLEPEENELQVTRFLERHPEFKLDPPPEAVPAVYIDDNDCLRITPYKHGMDGMFAARFKKG